MRTTRTSTRWAIVMLAATAAHAEPDPAAAEARLLTGARQLILEGKRSGEGYFSADGTRMVFQSEREPGNPFFQMYVLDLALGDVERVSPGIGKTTCGWLHPTEPRVLFASTHDDPDAVRKQEEELERRASGTQSRYSWSFDDQFELYEFLGGNEYRRLTEAPGYDAEGSYSPDGRWIAFASNRSGYVDGLGEAERERLAIDPQWFVDLYIMRADGSDVRRLTDTPGYDGGPFFSPDGERIVWRRFSEDGAVAEIWSMRTDGTDARQLTELGVMSWAPFYHPSGEYVIFANNAHGFGNFELYLVDADGAREPVRVTHTEGFDGLPVFTPDGARLAWTSKRGGGAGAQIFMADWNDAAARAALALDVAGEAVATAPPELSQTASDVRADDLRLHVGYLASEALEGRMTGSEGERLATEYVSHVFRGLGLAPSGDDGGWFQEFEFTSGVSLDAGNRLQIELPDGTAVDPVVDLDWRPLGFSESGPVPSAPVVFAGYGIVAPEADGRPRYDSYGEADLEGKWVLVLRFMPERGESGLRHQLSRYFALRYKAMLARERGAAGLLVVTGPGAEARDELVTLGSRTVAGSAAGLPVVSLTDATARYLLDGADETLGELQRRLDEGETIAPFELPGVRVSADVSLLRERARGRNVLGRLVVGDAPSSSVVVVGAHVDHIGRGEVSSLATGDERQAVHYGADDNASGTGAVLEIAQYLTSLARSGRLEGGRDLVFAAWSGEELGALGSAHYVRQLDLEPDAAPRAIAAYLNLDMIGRFDGSVYLQGTGSSPIWPREIERRNAPIGLPVVLQDDAYLPTDTTSFYVAGVPILNAFTGSHTDYNTPRDTADRIDYDSAAKISRLMALVARSLSLSDDEPEYVAVEPAARQERAALRAYLGTVPEYGGSDVVGVLLGGVAAEGPAEQAGVRAGDVIVELDGATINDIYDYTYALNAIVIGEPVEIVVVRDGERIALEITPGSRD